MLLVPVLAVAQTQTQAPPSSPAVTAEGDNGDASAPVESEEEARIRLLEAQLAEQEAATELLRAQLQEVERQSAELERVVGGLEDVNASVERLEGFEVEQKRVAAARVDALATAVDTLNDAADRLYRGDRDVLRELAYAASVLEGHGREAALWAAELVRREDLFNARTQVQAALQEAQRALAASGEQSARQIP